jgi:hypothetical protein
MKGRSVVSTKGSQCRFLILIILECEMTWWKGPVEQETLKEWINKYNE